MNNYYYCATCGSPARKPEVKPATVVKGVITRGTLGTWSCSGDCKGAVKVKRQKGRGQ